MKAFKKWEIWKADVPYEEDKSKSGFRPVVIISETEVLVLKMTTHQNSAKPKPYEYELMKWTEAGLPNKTFVQCNRFIRLNKSACTNKKYGVLQAADIISLAMKI